MRVSTLLVPVLVLASVPGLALDLAPTGSSREPAPASTCPGSDPASYVVVAVVDTGINPYHREFADPAFTAHPCTYISGYPATATSLPLTLDATKSYGEARNADASVWTAVQKDRLYWIPGTRIVGAYDAGDVGFAGRFDPTPILDDDGHGTAVASVAVGATLGTCTRCLLVVVEDPEGLAWATSQPWIDVVVNSWIALGNVGVPNPDERLPAFDAHFATRAAAECGQSILFATGNGLENAFVIPLQTYLSEYAGPSWVLRVGAYRDGPSGPMPLWGTGKPVSALGKGWDVPAAAYNARIATASAAGTSIAAPWMGGVLASVLLRAREAFADATEGRDCNGAVLASGSGTGSPGSALADGRLDRGELWAAFLANARPTGFRGVSTTFPLALNDDELAPFHEGYGVVDRATGDAAFASLGGTVPSRPDVASFARQDAAMRDAVWGAWDRDGDGDREAETLTTAWPSLVA